MRFAQRGPRTCGFGLILRIFLRRELQMYRLLQEAVSKIGVVGGFGKRAKLLRRLDHALPYLVHDSIRF